MRTKARHETISFEVVEWSEQLRLVNSSGLALLLAGFESGSGVDGERKFCVLVIFQQVLISLP